MDLCFCFFSPFVCSIGVEVGIGTCVCRRRLCAFASVREKARVKGNKELLFVCLCALIAAYNLISEHAEESTSGHLCCTLSFAYSHIADCYVLIRVFSTEY